MNSFFPFQAIKTRWQRFPIRFRGGVVLIIPLACLIASVGAEVLLRQKVLEAEKYVDRTQELLLSSQLVLVALLNAETGVRGFNVSRDVIFLEPYNMAKIDLPPALDQIKDLVQNNPSQAKTAQQIKQLAQERMVILQKGVQYIRDSNEPMGKPALTSRPILLEGKQKMDEVRVVINQFESEERRSLMARKQILSQQREYNIIVIWVTLAVSILGTSLSIILFASLVQDLRDRERNLLESKSLTQIIVANVVDSVVILNLQNQIESFNNAAIKMFGYGVAEVAGKDWRILLPEPTDAINEIFPFTQAKITEIAFPWQTMGHHKTGNYFPVEISISDIALDHRRILIIRDISDRQNASDKLQARADELTELNENLSVTNWLLAERNNELDQFAYVASHDLKAPLRAIANLSVWIEEDLVGQIPAENQKQMQLLRDRVYRMDALLDGLLEYSRAGRVPTQLESVDVGAILIEVIETIAPPSSLMIVMVSPNMPTFSARKMLIKQVFTNLIDNAIKHHPSDSGMVKVAVKDLGDRYEFAVTDDGKGIDPQFHEKIFYVFQTLVARDVKESTGIGLAIVKKIVEGEGGVISLESEVGKGTTFRFTWLKSTIGSVSSLQMRENNESS